MFSVAVRTAVDVPGANATWMVHVPAGATVVHPLLATENPVPVAMVAPVTVSGAFPLLVTTTGRVVVDPSARSPKARVVWTCAAGAGTATVDVATSPSRNRRASTLRRVSTPSAPALSWVTVMTFSPATVAATIV